MIDDSHYIPIESSLQSPFSFPQAVVKNSLFINRALLIS